MNKTVRILGTIVLVALLCIACDNGSTNSTTDLEGTWNASDGRIVTFTGKSFDFKNFGTTIYSGIFSVSGSTITFDESSLGVASGNFYVSGKNLTLSNHTWDNSVNGTYAKHTDGEEIATVLDGEWNASAPARSITLSGYNWVYAENGSPYSSGTWSTDFAVAYGSSGKLTLTINEISSGGAWVALPSDYQGVKENRVAVTINAEGTTMILSDAVLTTAGLWGTTEGTYTRGAAVDEEGSVSSGIIPDAIRGEFTGNMPIHSGTTPPDISGQFRADNFTLTGSSDKDYPIGSKFADLYIAFIKGADEKLSYRERQGTSESGSDDVVVEIVGSGDSFTAYFVTTGTADGITNKMSTVISGTLTDNGISNFYYAFVMLEKGPDPTNKLVPVNTYRIFKDGDGEAVRYTWR